MPRQDDRRTDYRALFAPPEEETGIRPPARLIADLVRAIGERAVPLSAWAVRMGSGAASSMGMWPGAAISGAGEALAQKIEGGEFRPGRVVAEAGIGAVPFAKTISAGKMLMSALKGGTLSTAGTVARKASDAIAEGSTEPLKQWTMMDAVPSVLGTGMSGVIGKAMKPPKAPVKDYEIVPTAQPGGQVLDPTKKTGIVLTEGNKTVKGTGAVVKTDPNSPKAGMWRVTRHSDGKTIEVPDEQAASRFMGKDGFTVVPPPKEAVSYTAPNTPTPSAARKEAQDLNAEARSEKARDTNLRKMEKAAAEAEAENNARNKVAAAKEGLVPQPKTVSESAGFKDEQGRATVSQKFAPPAADLPPPAPKPLPDKPLVDERKGLMAMTRERVVTALKRDPDEMVKTGELLKDGDNYRVNPNYGKRTKATTPAGGVIPTEPVAPKEGVFQIVGPDGKVIEVADAATAEAIVNQLGSKSTVIPPPGPKTSPTPRQKPVTGTAGQVTERLEQKAAAAAAKGETPPVKPPTDEPPAAAPIAQPPTPLPAPAPAAAAVEPPTVGQATGPLSAVAKMQELGYAPEDLTKMSAKEVNEIIQAGTRKAAVAVPEASPEAPFARFFSNPKEALRVGALVEEQPAEHIGKMWQLAGQAETGRKLQRGKGPSGVPREQETSGSLWQMVRQLTDDLGLPSMPRGADARPNFKHVPEDIRPKPSAAVPVVDARQGSPAAPPVKAPTKGPKLVPKAAKPVATAQPPAAPPVAPTVPVAPPQTSQGASPIVQGAPTLDRNIDQLDPSITITPGAHPAQPIPAELEIRMKSARDQMEMLENTGRGTSPEATKLGQAIEKLQQEVFAAQYPELVAELAKAEQAAKAAPKGKGPRNPESGEASLDLLMNAGAGLGGAAIGGAISEDDPWGGAALGGLAGVLGSKALQSLRGVPHPTTDAAGQAPGLFDRIVNFQRGAMLAHPENLMANFVAPTTGGALASMERMLAGVIERTGLAGPVTNNWELGVNGLRNSLDPRRAVNIRQDAIDAAKLISESERADLARGGAAPTLWDKVVRMPADILTTGDVGERKALMKGGWSEDQARVATNTSEPRYPLGEWITNIGRSWSGGRLLLPFSKTAANVLEGSLERMPIVGIFMHMAQKDPKLQASAAEIAAQQGMGGVVSLTSYMLGRYIDPEDSRLHRWPLIVTNLSGQYGALAGAAFAAGQAAQNDDSMSSHITSAGRSLTGDVPLPTTEPLGSFLNAAAAYSRGEPPNPQAESSWPSMAGEVATALRQWTPTNLQPAVLRFEPSQNDGGIRNSYKDLFRP